MKNANSSLMGKIKRIDPILLASTSVLSLISILTIFGSVENFGRSKLIMQVAMTLVGIAFVFLIANLDYSFFVDRFYIVMFVGSVVLLVLTLIFGISGTNIQTQNRSWIVIPGVGIAIQPSEFVKITFLCGFSKHIDMVKDRISRPKTALGLLVHAAIIIGLILASGDLGVALVYIGIVVVMLFCAGLSLWYFLGAIAAVAIAFPFLWDLLKPYQQARIIFGFQPELDPSGVGMQPLMSREVISRGGFFGIGLFEKGMYEDLVASHTDFIFAMVCEKFGFLGGALVVVALVTLTARLLYIGFKCRDTVGKLICCGCAAVIIVQTIENLWMCLAVVPVIGITLPFVSAGGSSVLATYMMVGLAHSVSAHEKKFYFRGEV